MTGPQDLLRPEQANPYLTPRLATCSFFEYRRGTGTPVRITIGAPRVALPDPRWGEFTRWPDARLLHPGHAYFRKGLDPERFRDRYIADLDAAGPAAIAAELRGLPVEDGRLVLLCFEKTGEVERNPWVCHRRVFAEWWHGVTGMDVPELNTDMTQA